MTVKLYVNWRTREIITTQQLEERVGERVKEYLADKEYYEDALDDYLECNYTKMELFEALISDGANIEEVIGDIRSGVAESIYDYIETDVRSEFDVVNVEV